MDLEGKLEAEAEDRISELPDAILCHILSFLPTTLYAVRTTILSTRWKNVWTSVPNLVFEDREFPGRFEAFMMFVDCVFSLRNNSSNILKFRFLGGSNVEKEDISRIDRWICTAVRGNVVELDLQFYSGTFEFKMPQSVFICKTLVTLRVESDCISYAPPSTSGPFPSLKLLDFTAFNDYTTSLVKLCPFCPVLEDLVIGINGYDKNVRISAPELKTLRIHSPWDEVIEFFIDSLKLEYLDVCEQSLSPYSFENAKSLSHSQIFFNYEDVDCASRLLGGVSCVRYLSLEAPNFLECHLPTFNHLKQLKLLVFYSSDWEEFVTELTAFLKRSPRLEHLVLEIGLIGSKCEGDKEPFNPPESVPSCLLSHLKTISISVKGYENQLQVVKYLLKFSEVLTTMTISLTSSHCKAKQELYEEILTFQKGLKTSELEYV